MKNLKKLGKVLGKKEQMSINGGQNSNICALGLNMMSCQLDFDLKGCCSNGKCVSMPSNYNSCIDWYYHIYGK